MNSISNIFKDILTNRARQEKKSSPQKNFYQKKKPDSENYVKPPYCVRFPTPEGELFDDPFGVISKFPESDKKILGLLIYLSRRFSVVAPSQEYIGRKTGYSRRTVISAVQRLHNHKLIYKAYRHKRTCFYNISPFLIKQETQAKLRTLFSAFKRAFIFSLSLLTSSSSALSEGFTLFTKLRNNKEVYSLAETTLPARNVMKSGHTVLLDITKKLNLTKWGQIRLAAFPEDALKEVLDNYEFAQKYQKKKIDNEFSWFFKGCLVYCNEHKLAPDWDLMKKLERSHGMPTNPVFVSPRDEIKDPKKGCEEKKFKRFTPSLSQQPKALNKEVSASQLYPVWKPETRKTETAEQAKRNVMEYLARPETENIAKLFGKELFENIVANCMLKGAE